MTDEELKAAEAWWMSVNIPPWARGEARKLFAHIRHLQAENERLRRLELERSKHLKEMQRLGQEFEEVEPKMIEKGER